MPTFLGLVDAGAARLTDPRLYGVHNIDLRSKYNAPQDGLVHPLSDMGLAAAQKMFANIGLDANTDLTKWSQDDAAAAQAEYEIRTGAGGIIGLAEGGRPMLTRQLYIQQAYKTWLHGARDTLINTAGCGTTPAIRLSGNRTGKNTLPLCDIEVTTGANTWASNNGGGVAGTGFAVGATAFALDNVVAAEMKRVAWSGYDKPFAWGDEVYNLQFSNWSAGQNNVGVNYDGTGADSGERMFWKDGCASNNNYGFLGDYKAQGGSAFLLNNSFDYNIVRQIKFLGLPANVYSAQVGLHVIGNHIETTVACSGTTPRIFSSGSIFLSENDFYEGGGLPTGFVETDGFSSVSATNNRMDADRIPLVIIGGHKIYGRVEGYGNVGQNPLLPVYLLKSTDGVRLQPSSEDGTHGEVKADPGPLSLDLARLNLMYSYAGNQTLPSDAQVPHEVGTVVHLSTINGALNFTKGDGNTVFYLPSAGTTGNVNLANYSQVQIRKYAANSWIFEGAGFSPA